MSATLYFTNGWPHRVTPKAMTFAVARLMESASSLYNAATWWRYQPSLTIEQFMILFRQGKIIKRFRQGYPTFQARLSNVSSTLRACLSMKVYVPMVFDGELNV